jgi:hypothetical protein
VNCTSATIVDGYHMSTHEFENRFEKALIRFARHWKAPVAAMQKL